MRYLILAVLVTLISTGVFSQTTIKGNITTITGKVTDKKNALAGISITLKDTYDGATSDSTGRYTFRTEEKGEFILTATAIGYKPFEQKIKLEGGTLTIDIVLKEEITELSAVTITAGTFEASDRKRAGVVLNSIDVVTTASANGDITGALKTLPGAQQVGESEGLFVRGGTAAETRMYIDGTLVNKFFYSSAPNIAGYGRFNPFIFKGTVFSTGGYSALYGQALSSAVLLESIDLPERTSATAGISVLSIDGGYQHLNKKKTASWGITAGYTNLGLAFELIKQQQDYSIPPTYYMAEGNFRIKTSKTGMFKYYGSFSKSKLAFTTPSLDTAGFLEKFDLRNIYHYHNLSWKETIAPKWRFMGGLSYSNNQDDVTGGMQDEGKNDELVPGYEFKNYQVKPRGNYFNAKAVFERRLKNLSAIRFGSEYNYAHDKATFTDFMGNNYPTGVKDKITSGFAEADIYITNGLAAKFGARAEHSSYLSKTNFAPRVSLAYKTGKYSQASLAYGIFYQDPETRTLPSPNTLIFQKATHYIAQYQKTTNLTVFRAEAFYKKYDDLVKTGIVSGREGVAINNNGSGDAKGFEIFWRDKKTIKNLDYWISYSYLDTKRDFQNFPYMTTPNFAAKHTASLVIKKFVMPWKTGFNASYNYASSRPYYNIRYDGGEYKFTDSGLVPDYHNVSFSLNFIPAIGKENAKSWAVYVLQVSNIFNIKQVYGYQYSSNGMVKQEIVPPSRMFVFIGAFFSFGIDRTQDAINDNL